MPDDLKATPEWTRIVAYLARLTPAARGRIAAPPFREAPGSRCGVTCAFLGRHLAGDPAASDAFHVLVARFGLSAVVAAVRGEVGEP